MGKGRRTKYVQAREGPSEAVERVENGRATGYSGEEKTAEALDVEGGISVVNDGGNLCVWVGLKGEKCEEDMVQQVGLP